MKHTDYVTPAELFDSEELETRFEMTPWIGDCPPPTDPEPEPLEVPQ